MHCEIHNWLGVEKYCRAVEKYSTLHYSTILFCTVQYFAVDLLQSSTVQVSSVLHERAVQCTGMIYTSLNLIPMTLTYSFSSFDLLNFFIIPLI